MLFFGEHVSTGKGKHLFPLFWMHVLLSPARGQRKRTIWIPFGCVFLRLCSYQLCGLDSPGLCKLNHAFLGFYGFHPFPPSFPPSVLTSTSTSLTLGWINVIGAEREAGPRGLGRGLTGWAGAGGGSQVCLRLRRPPEEGGIGGGEWGEGDSFCSRAWHGPRDVMENEQRRGTGSKDAKNEFAWMAWKGKGEMGAHPGGETA